MTDELEILRAWAPPDVAPPPPDGAAGAARARARVALHAHIAAAPPARRARWRRRLLVTVPTAAALAALVVALVVALGTSGQVEPPRRHPYATAPTTAAAALERAARGAETASPAFPRPDQFFYTKSIATYLACSMDRDASYCALSSSRREAWISQTRRGEIRTVGLGVSWPSPAERRKWIAAGRPRLAAPGDGVTHAHPDGVYHVGDRRYSAQQMRDFDGSGAQLFRQVRDGLRPGQGPSPDGEVFVLLDDALRDQPLAPRMRAAVLRALALVPGIGFDGHAKDRLGRSAFAISRVANGTRRDILLDPATGVLLGERDTLVAHVPHETVSAPLGTVIGDAAYERTGVVDAAGQQP
ncbi:MAG TPA: CU044_5270 family protein [Baekduia sp.]|uniref:CU044_5270 family protein n=1 Tax=Baekduia sp. TaxID=2600305 RepID=UPI002D777096|nr:CU044_5270 family protein [Baekduia sp.]HET6506652.1 CU044_5270 family protein [Baekduia sp.]